MHGKHVPASLFAGVTDTEQEAVEMAFQVNAERDRAIFASKAKHGLGGILGAK